MKKIPLSKQGKHKGKYFAKVDDADFEWLNQFNWKALITNSNVYAVRSIRNDNGTRDTICMHRLILNMPKNSKLEGDHKDHDGLNNQRNNLRKATSTQNRRNTRKRGRKSSKYLGVHWSKCIKRWIAAITINRKSKHIGTYTSETLAARAYDQAAIIHFKEFANTNFKNYGKAK